MSIETYKGQVVIPLDATFFPSSAIPNMTPFQALPTRFVLENPATALGDVSSTPAPNPRGIGLLPRLVG